MSTTSAPPTTKPRRRSLQFSLRTLLVVVLIVSVPLGLLGVKVKQARDQREAVDVFRKRGGLLAYERPDPLGPIWLIDLLGRDFLEDISFVHLNGTSVTGDFLPRGEVDGETSLHWDLDDRVTDDELEDIKNLPRIKDLALANTRVSDMGLIHLKGLTQLERLDLRKTFVTDAGLNHLKGFTRLQELDLRYTKVTDAGVAELQKAVPNCQIIR